MWYDKVTSTLARSLDANLVFNEKFIDNNCVGYLCDNELKTFMACNSCLPHITVPSRLAGVEDTILCVGHAGAFNKSSTDHLIIKRKKEMHLQLSQTLRRRNFPYDINIHHHSRVIQLKYKMRYCNLTKAEIKISSAYKRHLYARNYTKLKKDVHLVQRLWRA